MWGAKISVYLFSVCIIARTHCKPNPGTHPSVEYFSSDVTHPVPENVAKVSNNGNVNCQTFQSGPNKNPHQQVSFAVVNCESKPGNGVAFQQVSTSASSSSGYLPPSANKDPFSELNPLFQQVGQFVSQSTNPHNWGNNFGFSGFGQLNFPSLSFPQQFPGQLQFSNHPQFPNHPGAAHGSNHNQHQHNFHHPNHPNHPHGNYPNPHQHYPDPHQHYPDTHYGYPDEHEHCTDHNHHYPGYPHNPPHPRPYNNKKHDHPNVHHNNKHHAKPHENYEASDSSEEDYDIQTNPGTTTIQFNPVTTTQVVSTTARTSEQLQNLYPDIDIRFGENGSPSTETASVTKP